MKISISYFYKTTVWLVTLLACWLGAEAQTRTVQLPDGKLVYTISNLGETITVQKENEVSGSSYPNLFRIVSADIVGDKLSAGTEIKIDITYYPNNNGEGVCTQLRLDADNCVSCVNRDPALDSFTKDFKGTSQEFFRETATSWNYSYTTRKSPHHISRTFRVNQDITKSVSIFFIEVEFYVIDANDVGYDRLGRYDVKSRYNEKISVRFVDSSSAIPNPGKIGIPAFGPFDTLTQLLGLDQHATPTEAVLIGTLAAILAVLLGGAGGGLGGLAGGAGGGAMPLPIEGAPGGPPPIQNPFQGVEDKYVTRHPDGSITIKDPVTGEPKLYLPDGQGGYDNPLGGGFKSEEDMLNHLAYLDRNSNTLSQDAETAARNQAEQRAIWDAMNARDLERGYSDEMADYKEWMTKQEHEIKKEEQIARLASQYGVEATEEAVRKALKKDMIQAGIESAKQQAEAARNDMIVVGLESTKNVATTSLVLIPLALSGVGTVSAATMVKVKLVQSCYTMATSITDKVGDAYVKGENMATAAVHGVVTGTVGVLQNYAGDIGGMAAGKLAGNASKLVQGAFNLGTEAAVVIGGEGFKKGYDKFTSGGDLKETIDATIKGLKDGTKTHLINKTMEFGLDKVKGWATSGKPTVESTQAHVQATGKTVTTRQQAVTRTQQQVTTAKQRVTAAQQNATHSQQQVATARGKLNTANEQLRTANNQVATAQQKLGQAKTPAEASQARAELATAQQGAAQAQQNVNRANSELQTAQRIDTATQRVAQHAENDLQKAQIGAQKAQSDLKTATAQHQQALRDAHAAEQQAQVDKTVAHMTGNDIVGGGRAVEEHLKNEGYLPKDDKK